MAPSASLEALPSIAAISPTAIGRSGPVADGDRRGVDGEGDGVGRGGVGDARVVGDGEGGGVDAGIGVGVGHGRAVEPGAVAHVPAVGGDLAVDVVAGAAAQRDRLAGGGVLGLARLGDGREVHGDLAGGGAEVAGVPARVLDPQHGAVEAGALVGVGGGGAVRLGAVGEGPVVAGERAVGGCRAAAVEGDGLAGGGGDRLAGVGDGRRADVDGDGDAGAAGDLGAGAEDVELGLIAAGLGRRGGR